MTTLSRPAYKNQRPARTAANTEVRIQMSLVEAAPVYLATIGPVAVASAHVLHAPVPVAEPEPEPALPEAPLTQGFQSDTLLPEPEPEPEPAAPLVGLDPFEVAVPVAPVQVDQEGSALVFFADEVASTLAHSLGLLTVTVTRTVDGVAHAEQ